MRAAGKTERWTLYLFWFGKSVFHKVGGADRIAVVVLSAWVSVIRKEDA